MFELNAVRFCVINNGASSFPPSGHSVRYRSISRRSHLIQENRSGMAALGDLCSQPQLLTNLAVAIDHITHRQCCDLSSAQSCEMGQHQGQPVPSRVLHLRHDGQQPFEFRFPSTPRACFMQTSQKAGVSCLSLCCRLAKRATGNWRRKKLCKIKVL
ncbi:hypothetical protein [Thauera sp. SDU_THAU2]|uniref:hypothetical protein n=1 Tax=Thauera sp. SDU_THAU2 TaxID=3136633 RepID=UPI00312006F4